MIGFHSYQREEYIEQRRQRRQKKNREQTFTEHAFKPHESHEYVKPLWPSKGFWSYVRYEIRKGLMFRYWYRLPAMYKKELEFREDLENCINKH